MTNLNELALCRAYSSSTSRVGVRANTSSYFGYDAPKQCFVSG